MAINEDDFRELERENRFLREILDKIPEGIYAVSNDGRIIVYNKAMEDLEQTERKYVLGYKDDEVYNVFPPENYLGNEVLAAGKPILNRRLTYHMATGYRVEMVTDAFPYYQDDKLDAVYCIMNDISGINRLQERIITLNSLLCHKEDDNKLFRNQNGTSYTFSDIIGEGKAIVDAKQQAKHIALSFSNVLIYGETGTGKELFAQSIHNSSHFKEGPFIAINCAAIPATLLESQLFGTVAGAFSDARDMAGFFEQAENGTLFLDEINSMDLSLQAKLLRVLQDKTICRLGDKKQKRINCRIICATNKNPLDAEFKKTFREDLLYRLMTIVLFLPPLREHKEDIDLLCKHYLKKLNHQYNTSIIRFDDDFKKVLSDHSWPGNTRQLVAFLESCVCNIDPRESTLKVNHIPSYLSQQFSVTENYCSKSVNQDLTSLLKEYEKKIVEDRIRDCKGNLSRAAKSLGMSRQNMNYKLNTLGIRSDDFLLKDKD